MTNEEKNKWLTENILKQCWHEWKKVGGEYQAYFKCLKCNRVQGKRTSGGFDFYTSDFHEQTINFLKLWRAVKDKQ